MFSFPFSEKYIIYSSKKLHLLSKLTRIPKTFYQILILFLSIKGKINFLQLSRFSEICELEFCYFFEQFFDFLSFNRYLIKINIQGKTAIRFGISTDLNQK